MNKKWWLRWAGKLALSFFREQVKNNTKPKQTKNKNKKNKDNKMPESFPDKKPSSVRKIQAETKQVTKTLQELDLPVLFESYTYSYNNGVVTTLGGIAQLDQDKLIDFGWIKLNDFQFASPKENNGKIR